MRLDEPGTLFHITWFVFEFVVEPVSAILAALHDDLRPGGGHDREQSISVEAPEGGQPLIDRGHRGGPGDAQTEHERELDQRNGQGDAEKRDGELARPATRVVSRGLILLRQKHC